MIQSSTSWGRFAALATAGATVLATAGCSAGGSENTADAAPASSFSVVVPAAGDTSPYAQIAELYQKETGVEVEVRQLPPDAFSQTVRTELQAGTADDLIGVSPGASLPTSVLPLQKAGSLLALTNDSTDDTILKGTENLYTVDGEIYAQPTAISVHGLITSESALSTVGVEYPDSFDGFLQACRRTAGSPALVALGGAAPSNTSVLALELSVTEVYAQDPNWNEKRAAGEVTFSESAGWKRVLELIVEMNEAGCFQPGAEGAGFEQVFGALLQGGAVSTALASAALGELNGANPNAAFDVRTIPASSSGKPYVGAGQGFAFGVNAAADASKQAAALKFLDWLAQPEKMTTLAGLEGGIDPVTLGSRDSIPKAFQHVADALVAGDFVDYPGNSFPNAEVTQVLGSGVQGLLTGQQSVEAVLQAMDQAWG